MADAPSVSHFRLPFSAVMLVGCYAVLSGLIGGAVWAASRHPGQDLPMQEALLPWQALVIVVAGVLIGGLLIRKVRARMAWELLLGITLFLGVWFYFWVVGGGEAGLLIAAACTFAQAWVRRVWVHDLFILFGTAGVALNFAYLFPAHAPLVLLVGFAAYDTFVGRPGAVGARLVASLVHRGMVPGLIVPDNLRGIGTPVHLEMQRLSARFLGVGDLVLPSVAVARAFLFGVWPALWVAAGTIAAAAWLGWRRDPRPFPALVPLAIGAGVPYAVFLMLSYL